MASDGGKVEKPQQKPAAPKAPVATPGVVSGTRAGQGMSAVLEERREAADMALHRASGGTQGTPTLANLAQQRGAPVREAYARIMRKPSGSAPGGATKIPQGGGAPLAQDSRTKLETHLGADLSAVRVHTGGESADSAKGFGARAFTVGNDVHFGKGEFQPGTKEGDKLLAHELTHVVQGAKSGVQRKADDAGAAAEAPAAGSEATAGAGADAKEAESEHDVSEPGEPAEKEADAVADHVADKMHGDGEGKKGVDGGGKAPGGKPDAKEKGGAGAGQEKAPPIAAKLEGIGTKIHAKKDAKPAKTPAAPTGEKVNVAPILGKLDMALDMFNNWLKQGTCDVAGKVITALNAAKSKAGDLKTAQEANATPDKVKPIKDSLATQLQAIQTMDPEYELFSIGDMALTVKNCKKQMDLIPVKFTCGAELVPHIAEYNQHLKDQANGINAMSCAAWVKNRDAFLARQKAGGSGRDPKAKTMQGEFNKRSGSGKKTNTAAPHNSDQVSGGHADPTGMPVNASINSSTGGQWPDKIGQIDGKARAVPELKQLYTQMNVELTAEPKK